MILAINKFWSTKIMFRDRGKGNFGKVREESASDLWIENWPDCRNKQDKVFKNGPSKICGRQPLKKFK